MLFQPLPMPPPKRRAFDHDVMTCHAAAVGVAEGLGIDCGPAGLWTVGRRHGRDRWELYRTGTQPAMLSLGGDTWSLTCGDRHGNVTPEPVDAPAARGAARRAFALLEMCTAGMIDDTDLLPGQPRADSVNLDALTVETDAGAVDRIIGSRLTTRPRPPVRSPVMDRNYLDDVAALLAFGFIGPREAIWELVISCHPHLFDRHVAAALTPATDRAWPTLDVVPLDLWLTAAWLSAAARQHGEPPWWLAQLISCTSETLRRATTPPGAAAA